MTSDLAVRLSDDVLRSAFDPVTLNRGTGYWLGGHVIEMEINESEASVSGLVMGSSAHDYHTRVIVLDRPGGGSSLSTACTCPVQIECKHAAALLMSARSGSAYGVLARSTEGARQPPAWPWSRPAGWELALQSVAQRRPAGVPIGLQFEVVAPSQPATSSPYRAHSWRTAPQVRRIRLRPVVPGRSGNWVRSGVSWSQLRFANPMLGLNPAHHEALREIVTSYFAGRPYSYSTNDAVHLDDFGPGLWRLLDAAVESGVELLMVGPASTGVRLAGAASVAADLRRDRDGSLTVLRRLTVDDALVSEADDVDFVGSPAHGVAVRDAAGGLVLAGLSRRLDSGLAKAPERGDITIPPSDLDRFVTGYYPRLRAAVDVVSSDGSFEVPTVHPPRLRVTVSYQPAHHIELTWQVLYAVGDHVRCVALHELVPSADELERDVDAERRLVERLPLDDVTLPLRLGPPGLRRLVSPLVMRGMDSAEFVERALPVLSGMDDVEVVEQGERPDFRTAQGDPEIRFALSEPTTARAAPGPADWLDLDISVHVDGEQVPLGPLLTAMTAGDDSMLLDSGLRFPLRSEGLARLRQLVDEARALQEQERGPLRVSRYQAGWWQELQSLGVVDEQSREWAHSISSLLELDHIEAPGPPKGLTATLRPYQLEGFQWLQFLWSQRLGGILADDMGLGKTVQALALFCHVKEAGRLDHPVLVLAPASVVHNWASEAARFTPGLRVATLQESQGRSGRPVEEVAEQADVIVTSYALFRIDFAAYSALSWSMLLLDEAQFVKNHEGKTHQCVRRLAVPVRFAVTGTPLENNLMELWSLLSIVAPGLFPSPRRFAEFYRRPIERGTAPELLGMLRRRIRPLMRRRTKEEVAAELPPKQVQVLELELSSRHRRIYDTHLQRERQKILGLLEDFDKNRFTILKSLTLLRQLSLDPALVDSSYGAVRVAKVDVLTEQLHELAAEGHRALVFSQFTSFLGRVRQRLDVEGIDYCYLDGRTRRRAEVITAFKEGVAPVFLISLKAGGFGLNLTEADYCFLLDPWWNPAAEAQAIDRAHRIGQDRTVVVYRLVSADTIEGKVLELSARKAELFANVVDDGGLMSGPLSVADVRTLLEAQ